MENDNKKPIEIGKETEKRKQSADIVAKAEEAAKRLEDANAKMESLIARQEALAIERKLSGNAEAMQPANKSDEQLKKEEAMKFWEGTGIDQSIEKHG